ncbi:dihydrodipicolinate synthase family protein [Microlunatus sp. Y2014]|uniref:dihydrodipicolinate synthase family protein n=1 Tax=Microlunatus sp. Y2014 TaxID=3418488 RepID=UPI003B4FF929
MIALQGLVPIAPTPFDGSGQLDLDSLDSVLDRLVAAGVDGVAVLGMASEAITLTDDERLTVIRRAAGHLAGRVPLVAGCSHVSPEAVAGLAAASHAAGAAVLMVMPPSIGRPDDRALCGYFLAAADASEAVVMIQDNPGWHGVALSMAVYHELAPHPNIGFAKIETAHPPTTMAEVGERVGNHLAMLGGQAGTWLPEELARGIVGTMPGAIMPEVYRKIWDLWHAGDREAAVALFDRHHPLIRVTSTPRLGIGMTKLLLARAGVIANPRVRGPFPQLGPADVADLDAVVSRLMQPDCP